MTSRVVRKLNTSISFVDWVASCVAALSLGWCMYYVSEDIDPTVLSGLGVYIMLLCLAYYRRNWLAYRAYFEEKIPSRVVDSEAQSRSLRAQLARRPVDVAVVGRGRGQSKNVASFPAEIRRAFPAIADLGLCDGDSLSRRKLAGVLSRSKVVLLAEILVDLELAEMDGRTCCINAAGVEFFRGYAGSASGLGGSLQSDAQNNAQLAT